MQKVINVEAKRGQRLSAIVQNLDIYYPKDYCLSYKTNLKMQNKDSNTNNFKFKEFKPKNLNQTNAKTSVPA